MKRLILLISFVAIFISFEKPAPVLAFFGSDIPFLTVIASNTGLTSGRAVISALENTITAINQTESLYYETESLFNQLKNITNFQSMLMAGEQLQNMNMQLTSTAFEIQDNIDQSQGITPNYQAQSETMQNMGQEMALTGSLMGSAADIQNISQMAGGSAGFALLNGAAMTTQAALTTTQAIDNLMQYQAQQNGVKQDSEKVAKINELQHVAASRLQITTVPCQNRAAFVKVVANLGAGNVQCTQTGLPRPVLVANSPVGTGINAQINNSYEIACANAEAAASAAAAKASAAGIAAPPIPAACNQLSQVQFIPPPRTPPSPPPAIRDPDLTPLAPPMGPAINSGGAP